jgi:hypothetical protein
MNLDDIKTAEAALVAAYQKFTTPTHQAESFSFWFDKGNNEAKYAKYIKKGSPKEINIESALVKKFDALAAAHNFAGMNALFEETKGEVHGMLQPRLTEFSNSPEYKGYLAVKKMGNIDKALKLLGVDAAHTAAMKTLLKEYAMDITDAEKRATLAKMDKIAKHEQILAALKSAGLV